MTKTRYINPFAITKAVDLNNQQIENLWVGSTGEQETSNLQELDHPISPMPTFILGAKGSGKTHLMRHQAFELQKLRYKTSGRSLRDGISNDGYIGLYLRCSGLQSSRFTGKRQPDELWSELFSYYFELWLVQHMLYVAVDLGLGVVDGDEVDLVVQILDLFDKAPAPKQNTLVDLSNCLGSLQKRLDSEINNCLLRGTLDVEISATRGKLVFGLPNILANRYSFLRDVLFAYDIDEFENLTESQQIHVNTLIREKEHPTTFRIGSRTYGVRTQLTNSGGEANLSGSEYNEIQMDYEFRNNKSKYKEFSLKLIAKRLPVAIGYQRSLSAAHLNQHLNQHFEQFDRSWNGAQWEDYLGLTGKLGEDRPHFARLRNILKSRNHEDHFENAVKRLSVPNKPLVEKLNLLLLFQALSRKQNSDVAKLICDVEIMCQEFLNGKNITKFRNFLQHYSDDLAAQLLRENAKKQIYCGVECFISMSAGIPRALLTVLRSTFGWAVFQDEMPFDGGKISLTSQRKGVIDASNWYFNNMRKVGNDGIAIQSSVDRLSNIFRINRYGDKPIEVSLTTFSVSEQDMNPKAREVLKLGEDRSFLHRISEGHRDKNSERILSKYQLSPMLSPRSDLGLSRRGTLALSPEEADAIFQLDRLSDYKRFIKKFRSRVMVQAGDTNFVDENDQLELL